MPDQFPQKITQKTTVTFSVDKLGLYALSVIARCKSARMSNSHENGSLRAEIDDLKLREIPPVDVAQYNNNPSTWNGTFQQGLAKTVVFIMILNKGKHDLHFFPTDEATIEDWSCHQIENARDIAFALEKKAEDGDRRPWYTFAFIDTPLKSVMADVSVSWHLFDGDDVKLIIDGKIQENSSSKRWKYWLWSARPLQLLTGKKKEQKSLTLDLKQNIHYVEFWADKSPTLHQVSFDLGDFQPKRIPNVTDPEWTGNFADDPDPIILARALFGEARNTLLPDEARFAIAWVIKNRVLSKKWPNAYWEVITSPSQFSAFNKNDPNRAYIENPLHTGKAIDKEAWEHAFQIAEKVVKNEILDPTQGANHYYDDSINPPPWAKDKEPCFSITYINQFGKQTKIFFFNL